MTLSKLPSRRLTLLLLILSTMGLFSFMKKSGEPLQAIDRPYKDSATNLIYNLLFCDNLDLFKANSKPKYPYPYNVLYAETNTIAELQKIVDDKNGDPRTKILAYNKQRKMGHKPVKKELLGVIVEVGLDKGLDVLASFIDGTARYINYTGSVVVWETTTDTKANELTKDLFSKSRKIVEQIGPWDKPRKPHPAKGNTRISFLVSDGLYFGEGPTDVLFNDPMGSAALTSATQLMKFLTEKSLEKKQKR